MFKKQVQQTFADPRGWRSAGVELRRVASGSFTVVLAQASTVPSFSSGCSAQWSCRVGRYVIINQTRWLTASPSRHTHLPLPETTATWWVNHETGHWLGHGHVYCAGAGRLAPVMQQQSKSLQGCRHNSQPALHAMNAGSAPRSSRLVRPRQPRVGPGRIARLGRWRPGAEVG
ncbi:MAG: DUF3152 domain-containing protein [Nocardioides sp.]